MKNILGSGAYAPAVSPHGIQLSEFNFNKASAGASTATQAVEFCNWWKQARTDAQSGYWNEQSTLFITRTEDGSWANEYWLYDDQLDDVRNCQ